MQTDFESRIADAAQALLHARQLVADEIRDYPTPVAGCDVQYNRLLSRRSQIARALEALDAEVFVPTPRTLNEGSGVESR